MSYGDCNFPPPRVDMFRLMLLVGTIVFCLGSLVWVAVNDLIAVSVEKPAHVAHGPRNLPDGNTHLSVEKRTSL